MAEYSKIIFDVLKTKTKNNAIKMTELAETLDISKRAVRLAINSLRQESKLPICGDNNGYYMPANKAQWERVAARLRSQAQSLRDAADGGDEYYLKIELKQESLFKSTASYKSNYDPD